jgi:hypothetical protein
MIYHDIPVGTTTFCAVGKKTKNGFYVVRLELDLEENKQLIKELANEYKNYDCKFLTIENGKAYIHATTLKNPKVSLLTEFKTIDYGNLVPVFDKGTKGSMRISTKVVGNHTVVANLVHFLVTDPVIYRKSSTQESETAITAEF